MKVCEGDLPLLDFVESLEERYRDENNDCLLAVASVELRIRVMSERVTKIPGPMSCKSLADARPCTSKPAGCGRQTQGHRILFLGSSTYLTSIDKLKRSQSALQVWDVRL